MAPPPGPPMDYRDAPEPQLQQRYHDHDPLALEELWRRHEATIRRCAEAWAHPDGAWADDATQDLYLRLSAEDVQQSYDPSRAWLHWCLGVLRHRTEDERRRRRRAPAQLEPGAEGNGHGPLAPAEEATLREFERELQDCVNRVPEPHRAVLALHLSGLDLTAMAERLNIPYGTAGNRLSRARQSVRECLASKGYDGGSQ